MFFGGNKSSLSKIIDSEKKNPVYNDILDHIMGVDKFLDTLRMMLKIDNVDVLFTTEVETVEEVLSTLDAYPLNILTLMTLIHIKHLDSFASALFVDLIESDKGVFEYLITLKETEKWPKRFHNIDKTKFIETQKNAFVKQTLGRAVNLKRQMQFVMSKINTDLFSFFAILERINMVYAQKAMSKITS